MARHDDVEGLSIGRQVGKAFANLDFFVTHFRVAPTRWGQVTVWIFFVKLFDVNILNVGPKVGRAPGDVFIVSEDNACCAGERYARNMNTRRDEFRLIPNARRSSRNVRIVCKQGLSCRRVRARYDPVVASLNRRDTAWSEPEHFGGLLFSFEKV